MVFLCRGDFRDALATNLDGDTVSQNDDIKIIGVVVAFACGGNFVANRVVLLYGLLFYDRERCCIVEKFFKNFSSTMALALHKGCLFVGLKLLFVEPFNNAASGCCMRYDVNENELAKRFVLFKKINDNGFGENKFADGNPVFGNAFCF